MRYEILAPDGADEQVLCGQNTLPPFDPISLGFVDAVSSRILSDPSFKRLPELAALAFWMRKANIHHLENEFNEKRGDRHWTGRGIAFHIAPGNVDTVFVYSWFISLLVGNVNIVRVSSHTTEQLEHLITAINEIASRDEFEKIRRRFMVVSYEHDDEITAHLSSLCDVRVIWGGDETVRRIRSIPISPAAVELTFSDKFSFSVIDAEKFIALDRKNSVVGDFYNDAFFFEQQACSSPRLVVWLGDENSVSEARRVFWDSLQDTVVQKQKQCVPATAVDKLVTGCLVAAKSEGAVAMESMRSNMINRLWLDSPDDIDRELHGGGGLFYELQISKLEELADIIAVKDQTISVFGVEAERIERFIADQRPRGVSRVVPFGQALNFSAVWDGHDLLRQFCREIDITL